VIKVSDPRLYDLLARVYDVGQKYGLYLLGTLGSYTYAEFARKIVEAGALRDGAEILDAGCGTGYLFPAFAAKLGPSGSITGVDFSRGQLERARARVRRLPGTPVQLHLARIEDLESVFPVDAFDAVYCAAVLPTLPNIPEALRQMTRVLRRGGSLVIWTVSAEALAHARFARYWKWAIHRYHLQYPFQPELERLVVAAGCDALSSEIIGSSLIIVARKSLSAASM
jgi:ubiquinone/menaquinone biosynthesis C-methylase UbiE